MSIKLKSNTGLPLIEANHPDDAGELNPFLGAYLGWAG